MGRRLMLGCGSIGHAIVGDLGDRREDLVVVESDRDRVETLREENVIAEHADPADEEAVRAVEGPIDVVIVAGDDPEANARATAVAAHVHPAATLVVYVGRAPPPSVVESVEEIADRVIEHGPTVSRALLSAIGGEPGDRLRRFAHIVRGVEGRLGVFMHDNPDPDAIGSAIALREIARGMGTETEACYFGEITHQENRALVNLLDLRLTDLDAGEWDPDAYDAIALVDHSRPGVNNQLPEDTQVDIVIDHHPPREPISARFVDLRSDAGATSTLLADYYRRLGIDPGATVATALLYGIRVDTRDFGREITQADFDAAAFLLPSADVDILERVENPSVSGDTLDTTARAIGNRKRYDGVLVSGVGAINQRDALAQAADRLLTMEDVTTTVVFGFLDGTVYASARARGTDLDVGEAMRQAFAQIGAAGGHTDMAGAQIPLGILGDVGDEDASLETVVSEVIENRFLEVLDIDPATACPCPRDPGRADTPASDDEAATANRDGDDPPDGSGIDGGVDDVESGEPRGE